MSREPVPDSCLVAGFVVVRRSGVQRELFAAIGGQVPIAPGAFHLTAFLTVDQQRALASLIDDLGRQRAGFYQPVLRGGSKMRLEMLCLGRHWDARAYRYEATRTDVDQLPVPSIPPSIVELARRAAAQVEMAIHPDILIINHYGEDGRLGIHQDKDERRETLDRGVPVVSISLGDDAEFLFGGLTKRDPTHLVVLRSGDAFVFGGPSRLARHGVKKIRIGTCPIDLGVTGRLNLTFRQF